MRTILTIAMTMFAVASTGAACGAQDVAPSRLPVVTLPAPLDRVLRDYEAAWGARDAKRLASLFTEDGFVLSGGKPPVRGRVAIEKHYAGAGGPLTLAALAHATSDSLGYIIGTYGGSNPATHGGKFVLTLRRAADGRWLIFSDMDNTNSR